MISDLDIYRSTNLLIDRHGEKAPIHAAMQAGAMLDKADLDGAAVWRWIPGIGREKPCITLPEYLNPLPVTVAYMKTADLE